MDAKVAITREMLLMAGEDASVKNVKKHLRVFWKNPRLNGVRSMSLTKEGYEFMKPYMKFYTIDLLEESDELIKNIIWLDKYLDCPFFLENKRIRLTREKTAINLMLYGGDLNQFMYNMARIATKTEDCD